MNQHQAQNVSIRDADKSFIIVLDRMKEQKLQAVKVSDPSVENHVIDGYKQGHYDCIKEVIEAFKRYG